MVKKTITRGFSKTFEPKVRVFGKTILDISEKSAFKPVFRKRFPKLTEFWKTLTILIIFCSFCFFGGCNVDIGGFFTSTDVDERLKERGNLKLLDSEGWTVALSLGDEYSFIVVSDTHIEDGNAHGLEKLKDAAAAEEIKFAVMLGDITQYGSERDINKYIEIAKLLEVPCYPVIGNHDIYFGNWSVWKSKIGSTNYKINGGNTTLLFLDSANSLFGKDQLDWLEREIKTASGRVFVFTHSPLFVTGPADMQQVSDTKERARIVSILRGKCDIMFMGHLHKRIITEKGNVKYLAMDDFVRNKTYCVVTVTASGVKYSFKKL